jgi:hypothetical protein
MEDEKATGGAELDEDEGEGDATAYDAGGDLWDAIEREIAEARERLARELARRGADAGGGAG